MTKHDYTIFSKPINPSPQVLYLRAGKGVKIKTNPDRSQTISFDGGEDSDYNKLSNLPKLSGKTINGDRSPEYYLLQKLLVEGNNIFLTENEDGTVSISAGNIELFTIVTELPEVGESNKIYLLPHVEPDDNNDFQEWAWIGEKWELLGTITVDLSNYYTIGEADARFATKEQVSRQLMDLVEEDGMISELGNIDRDTITRLTLSYSDPVRSIVINQEKQGVLHTLLLTNVTDDNIEVLFFVPDDYELKMPEDSDMLVRSETLQPLEVSYFLTGTTIYLMTKSYE